MLMNYNRDYDTNFSQEFRIPNLLFMRTSILITEPNMLLLPTSYIVGNGDIPTRFIKYLLRIEETDNISNPGNLNVNGNIILLHACSFQEHIESLSQFSPVVYITQYSQLLEESKGIEEHLNNNDVTKKMLVILALKDDTIDISPYKQFTSQFGPHITFLKNLQEINNEVLNFVSNIAQESDQSLEQSRYTAISDIAQCSYKSLNDIFSFIAPNAIEEEHLMHICYNILYNKRIVTFNQGDNIIFLYLCIYLYSFNLEMVMELVNGKGGIDYINSISEKIDINGNKATLLLCVLYCQQKYEQVAKEYDNLTNQHKRKYQNYYFYARSKYNVKEYDTLLSLSPDNFNLSNELEFKCALLVGKIYLKVKKYEEGSEFINELFLNHTSINTERLAYLKSKLLLPLCHPTDPKQEYIYNIKSEMMIYKSISVLVARYYYSYGDYDNAYNYYKFSQIIPEKDFYRFSKCLMKLNNDSYQQYLSQYLSKCNFSVSDASQQLFLSEITHHKYQEALSISEKYMLNSSYYLYAQILSSTQINIPQLTQIIKSCKLTLAQVCQVEAFLAIHDSANSKTHLALSSTISKSYPLSNTLTNKIRFMEFISNPGEYDKSLNYFNKKECMTEYFITKAILLQISNLNQKNSKTKDGTVYHQHVRSWMLHIRAMRFSFLDSNYSKNAKLLIGKLDYYNIVKDSFNKAKQAGYHIKSIESAEVIKHLTKLIPNLQIELSDFT